MGKIVSPLKLKESYIFVNPILRMLMVVSFWLINYPDSIFEKKKSTPVPLNKAAETYQ